MITINTLNLIMTIIVVYKAVLLNIQVYYYIKTVNTFLMLLYIYLFKLNSYFNVRTAQSK